MSHYDIIHKRSIFRKEATAWEHMGLKVDVENKKVIAAIGTGIELGIE